MKLILYSSGYATPGNNTLDYVESLISAAQQENKMTTSKQIKVDNLFAAGYSYTFTISDYKKAMQSLQECIRVIGNDTEYTARLNKTKFVAGGIYLKQGNLDSAILYTYPYFEEQKKERTNLEDLADAYNYMGYLYSKLGLHEKSIEAETEGYYVSPSKDPWDFDHCSRKYALIDHYISYYASTRQPRLKDSALKIANELLAGLANKKEYWYGALYCQIAKLHYYSGDYKAALRYLNASLDSQLVKSNVRMRDKNVNLAFKVLTLFKMDSIDAGWKILRKTDLSKRIYEAKEIYELLYKLAARNGKWEDATGYYASYTKFSDSISLNLQKGNFFEAEQKYASAEKQAAINTLRNKNLETQRLSSRHLITGVIAAFMLIILLLGLYVYFKKLQIKTAQDKLALLDSLHHVEATIATQRITYEAEAESSLKTEKKAISENMHDEISSGIAGLRYYITNLKMESVSDEAKETLATLEQEAQSLYLNARGFMNNLYQEAEMPENNVADLLRQFSKIFGRTEKLSVSYDYKEQEISQLPAFQNNELYLIIKELVINAVKHSGCSLITVSVLIQDGQCAFAVTDNGNGFNTASNTKRGIGIGSITNRLEALQGELKITSSTSGTKAAGSFPLNTARI